MAVETLQRADIPQPFDWNQDRDLKGEFPLSPVVRPSLEQLLKVGVDDEGLRDGLGSCVTYPTKEAMEAYLGLVEEVGLSVVTVGMYSHPDSTPDIITRHSLKVMREQYPGMTPIVLARARREDIDWASDCAMINPKLQVIIFRGSSGPRIWAEGITNDGMLKSLRDYVNLAATERGLPVIAFTEDTTRTPPHVIERFVRMAIDNGANSVGIADTVGHADPWGAQRITKAVRVMLDKNGGERLGIHWHGHRDRGLDISTTIAAISGGADVVHGVLVGAGERAGNTRLAVLLYNLNRLLREVREEKGYPHEEKWNLSSIYQMAIHYARMTGVIIPSTYPLIGENAFQTMLGIHADVERKALCQLLDIADGLVKPEDESITTALQTIAATVYSTVDANEVGRKRGYRLGPLSGRSSAIMWLWTSDQYEIDPRTDDDPRVSILLKIAKGSDHVLTDEEIVDILSANGFPPHKD